MMLNSVRPEVGVLRCMRSGVCGEERQGDTAWFRPGMCDVGRLYNRARLPEGGQWDECHPPAPSLLGDDHHTTLQLSSSLNHHCKRTYIMRTNTHVHTKTYISTQARVLIL